MFSLINWTIGVCERKQKNIWGKNMNHVTVCFSLNHPDWLVISLNPTAADTATPPGITLLVSSVNCLATFNCLPLPSLHYFPSLSSILSSVTRVGCLEDGRDNVCTAAQSYPTLCNTIDCSLPGSSVHGIFQARILEWVAISFSRGSSWPRGQTRVSCVSCIDRQILYHWARQ